MTRPPGKRDDDASALVLKKSDGQIGLLLAARQALAQAQTVREGKQIRDAAEAQ